jgi:hypothetical protein
VADVPQQPVRAGGVGAEVVNVVQGEGELNDAEVGRQVPAVGADGVDDALAHLLGELRPLGGGKIPDVRGLADRLEQRTPQGRRRRGLRH